MVKIFGGDKMLFGDIVYAAGTAPVQETAKAAGKNSVNGNFVLMILMLLEAI